MKYNEMQHIMQHMQHDMNINNNIKKYININI